MRTIPFSRTRLNWCDGDEHIVNLSFLGDEGLETLLRLIHLRRSLPVYRDGSWRCYECRFESRDLNAMAAHIVRAHQPAPWTEDDEADLCGCTDRPGAA